MMALPTVATDPTCVQTDAVSASSTLRAQPLLSIMNRLSILIIAFVLASGVLGFSRPPAGRVSTRQFSNLGAEAPSNAEVLSKDPLVYVVPNFLSGEECDSYMDQVHLLESKNRTMTRSNPPQVSLDTSRLWPLPFLSILAGIPTLLHTDLSTSTPEELQTALLPPISIAFVLSTALALAAVPIMKQISDSSSRTSDAMAFNQKEDIDFVRLLVDRVASTTQHAWTKWEAPVVTRYAPGAVFAKHGDASPTKGSEWVDTGGQRVVTCICYLNAVQEGGETAFDRLNNNIRVEPEKGKALFFFPSNAQTLEADDRTIHESLPPMEEKWIVQMFGRVGPRVPPPLGLPDAYAE
jgi:hypothetical protein